LGLSKKSTSKYFKMDDVKNFLVHCFSFSAKKMVVETPEGEERKNRELGGGI